MCRISGIVTIDNKLVVQARKDLAKRRGIPQENIILEYIESVDWSDTSLGCRQPGKVYAQVITPGYRIMFSDGITDFEYHTDSQQRVALYAMDNQSKNKK